MRGLIGGIPDREVILKQIHNSDHEQVVLSRFPFHEAMTQEAVFTKYRYAVQYLFQIVPEERWIAIMGRMSRKLIKRLKELQKEAP